MGCLQVLFLSFGLLATKYINNVQADLPTEEIRGGDLTKHDDFPYQVRIISFDGAYIGACGGSILDDYHILSAAHCFINYKHRPRTWKETSYIVIAGATDFKHDDSDDWVKSSVEKIYVPESYFNFDDGDIAILKLSESLDLKNNDHLQAVTLPSEDTSFYGVEAVVSGYGWNFVWLEKDEPWGSKQEVGSSDGKLRFANTKVISRVGCRSNLICARVNQRFINGNAEGVCSGDSGGPLVYNGNIQIGVVHGSPELCKENVNPGTYTRVTAYKDFISKARNYENRFTYDRRRLNRDPQIRVTVPPYRNMKNYRFDLVDGERQPNFVEKFIEF